MNEKQVDLEGNEVKVVTWEEKREPVEYLGTAKYKLKKSAKLDKLVEKGTPYGIGQYIRHNIRPVKGALLEDGDSDKTVQAIFDRLMNNAE